MQLHSSVTKQEVTTKFLGFFLSSGCVTTGAPGWVTMTSNDDALYWAIPFEDLSMLTWTSSCAIVAGGGSPAFDII